MNENNWHFVRISDVCEIIMGQSPPGDTYNKEGKGVPFYQGKIDFGKVYLQPPSNWCTAPTKIAEPGDVLISIRAPVGPTNLCGEKCCIGRGLAAMRPMKEVNSWFVFYYLQFIKDEISALGQGSTFSAISKSQICNLELPLPPLPEQKRIATKLQDLMQELDRARRACEKQLEAAKALPVAYLREVFESEEAQKWERKRLGEMCKKIIGGGTPSRGHPEYWDGSIYWLSPSELDEGKLNYVGQTKEKITEQGSKNSNAKLIPPNSVLLSCTASVGKVAINEVPLTTNQQFNSFVLKDTIAVPEFVAYYLIYRKDDIKQLGGKTTFTFISKDEIADLLIHFPPLSLQHRIAADLKEKMAQVERLRTAIENRLEAINALPQSILRKTFRGEL